MHSADANLSDYGDVADFREIAAQGLARGRRELNENTATVMRVRAPNKKALLGHRLQPAQRGRRWYGRGDAQAGNGYPKLRDLGLQEIEQHIPRGVGEQLFGKKRPRRRRARMMARTVSAGRSGRSPSPGRICTRSAGRGPAERRARVEAIRLTSSLSWRSRAALRSAATSETPSPRRATDVARARDAIRSLSVASMISATVVCVSGNGTGTDIVR